MILNVSLLAGSRAPKHWGLELLADPHLPLPAEVRGRRKWLTNKMRRMLIMLYPLQNQTFPVLRIVLQHSLFLVQTAEGSSHEGLLVLAVQQAGISKVTPEATRKGTRYSL